MQYWEVKGSKGERIFINFENVEDIEVIDNNMAIVTYSSGKSRTIELNPDSFCQIIDALSARPH